MQPIPAFNPGDTVTYPNGIGTIQVGAADAGAKMLLYNESPFNLNIDFLNGSQSILHAWEARYWTLDGDTRQVEWDINSSLSVISSPISLVIGELYGATERLEGTYPMGLIRQTNVGNPGGIVSSASTIVNDGNALLEVIEATLLGHASSDVIVNNDGSYTLKGAGLLAAVGVLTHILGTLTVDQAATITGVLTAVSAIINTVNSQAATNLVLNVPTAHKVSAQVNAIEQVALDVNGITLASGNKIEGNSGSSLDIDVPSTTNFVRLLNNGVDVLDATNVGPRLGTGMSYHFIVGTLSRQNGSGSTTCNGGTTISHGLGTTPALVLATPNIAQSGSATVGIGNVGATTFQATVGAGTLISWWCLAG